MKESHDANGAESGIGRRRVLQTVGAAGAAAGTAGIGSAGSARFEQQEIDFVKNQFEGLDDLKAALDGHEGILETLSEEGFLDDASVDALGIETLGWADSVEDSVVHVTPARSERGVTPDIRINPQTDKGALQLSIKPDLGEAFAVYKPEASSEWEQIAGQGCDCDSCDCYCNGVNYTSCCDCLDPECTTCEVTCYCSGW